MWIARISNLPCSKASFCLYTPILTLPLFESEFPTPHYHILLVSHYVPIPSQKWH